MHGQDVGNNVSKAMRAMSQPLPQAAVSPLRVKLTLPPPQAGMMVRVTCERVYISDGQKWVLHQEAEHEQQLA